MTGTQRFELWVACILTLMVAASGLLLVRWQIRKPIMLQGAVLAQDTDPRKELPIADAEVFAEDGSVMGMAKSDASGFFRVTLPKEVRRGQAIALHFRHP